MTNCWTGSLHWAVWLDYIYYIGLQQKIHYSLIYSAKDAPQSVDELWKVLFMGKSIVGSNSGKCNQGWAWSGMCLTNPRMLINVHAFRKGASLTISDLANEVNLTSWPWLLCLWGNRNTGVCVCTKCLVVNIHHVSLNNCWTGLSRIGLLDWITRSTI